MRWEERGGKPTPKLQGPLRYSPPSVVTLCQSLCCAFADAKSQESQVGGEVLLPAPPKHNIHQPWREMLSALPGNELYSLAGETGIARTPLFPCCGGRAVGKAFGVVLQLLWHPMPGRSYRTWGSREALSCPSASISLLC